MGSIREKLSDLFIIYSLCLDCSKLFSGARCWTKPALIWVSTFSIRLGEAVFRWVSGGCEVEVLFSISLIRLAEVYLSYGLCFVVGLRIRLI